MLKSSMINFISLMPKVELHVHLEGSIRPETLLVLAKRNKVSLPADNIDDLKKWYQFKNLAHFCDIYMLICNCIKTPEDIELVTTEFLKDRADQNILYCEVIYTPYSHIENIKLNDQFEAINKAKTEAYKKYGVTMGLVIDLSRQVRPVEHSIQIAKWAARNMNKGIIGFGLGGPEFGNPPELFKEAFNITNKAGLASLPHAGESDGPESIWGAINTLKAIRIGHGVRCLEDPDLVDYLREKQIPLDVSPTSNVCLNVVNSIEEHPLKKLINEGLFVTINSDDPPMFNTTLTNEYIKTAKVFEFDKKTIKTLVLNGLNASLLPQNKKKEMNEKFEKQFEELERK
ncbi:MAG: adenosine deaminase [bacterium]|nr:adenosine deaminase [bacterium]